MSMFTSAVLPMLPGRVAVWPAPTFVDPMLKIVSHTVLSILEKTVWNLGSLKVRDGSSQSGL